MTRITSTILVMMLLMNGTATIMEVSGLSDDLGVQIETGVDDAMDRLVNDMQRGFSPNINIIESFVSLALASVRVFEILVNAVYVAPTLMMNILGGGELVNLIVTVFMAPMYLISTLEIVFLATGRDTV